MALPITVEVLRNLRHDGAAHHHVGVGKGVFAVDVEIFVADIAPADNADAVVGNQGFVVHPAVQPRKIGQIADKPPFAVQKWVEQADLDVGVAVERGQDGVHAVRVVIVQQQAHAHAAFCRLPEFLQQCQAGGVVAPNIILRVNRNGGVVEQNCAGVIGGACTVEQLHVGRIGGVRISSILVVVRFCFGRLGGGCFGSGGRQVEGLFEPRCALGGNIKAGFAVVQIGQAAAGIEY